MLLPGLYICKHACACGHGTDFFEFYWRKKNWDAHLFSIRGRISIFFVTCILSAILIRLLLIILNTFWRVIWGLTRVSCTDRNFTGPYEFLPMKAEEISNSISLICLPPIINSLSYACHFSATTLIFFLLNMNKYLWFILGKA